MLSFSNINEIRSTLFLCGYIGYLLTGDSNKLEMSHTFLQNQLSKEFQGKMLKIKYNDNETKASAIILFEKIESLSMAFGDVRIRIVGTRIDQEPQVPGQHFFTTIEDIEYLNK